MEKKPTRKKNRLQGFDYSLSGEYFLTVCTRERKNLFWERDASLFAEENYTLSLSDLGKIAYSVVERTNDVYDNIEIDKFVIMSNHIHLLVSIYDIRLSDGRNADIPQVIKGIKGMISRKSGMKDIWQKGYYDHIIRNKKDYDETWNYIDQNPRKR